MTQEHPITPPPELFAEWLAEAKRLHPGESTGFIAGKIARLAYQAGADQELEACCEWVDSFQNKFVHARDLRLVRRPKTPSLKEQALEALAHILNNSSTQLGVDTIRRALEQLPDNN
jgi:hypothetical protein